MRGQFAALAVCVRATLPPDPAHGAPDPGSASAATAGAPIDLHVSAAQDETIIVMGRRPFVLAPLPGAPATAAPAIGPGQALGPFTVTGGAVPGGVSAGLAFPIRAVKGLEFDAGLGGSRDALSPTGTTAAASVTAGLRLRF